jgi:gliding motility-associated-like protein
MNSQCDLSIIDVNLNTYEVTVEIINGEGCGNLGPMGSNDYINMIQIGYHIPSPINSDNANIEDFNDLPGPPCSPNWNGYFGMFNESCHTGWFFSPPLTLPWDNEQLPAYTGDIVTVPLNPPGNYELVPSLTAECGDDLIDYWLDQGECIEFVIWQMNYGSTLYTEDGGWATGCIQDGNGNIITPPNSANSYVDDGCDNTWYLCRDENPGPSELSELDDCSLDDDNEGCTDENALNYDEDAIIDDGSCEYNCVDTIFVELPPDTIQIYTPADTIYTYIIQIDSIFTFTYIFQIDTFYLELPGDTIIIQFPADTVTILETEYITQYDTTYIELPPDTIIIYDTEYITQYDTTYIELPPDTITLIETITDTLYVELPPDTITLIETITDTLYVELPPDTITLIEFVTDTLYVELPPDTITLIEFVTDTLIVTQIDTVIETELIYITDTIYQTLYDTIISYEFILIDCITGLPCGDFIPLNCESSEVYIPNSFTPNNDGINDVWEVVLDKDCWDYAEVKIYNRWGEMIWYSDDINNLRWNGSYKDGEYYSQIEVYTWSFNAKRKDSALVEDLKGSVTIVR